MTSRLKRKLETIGVDVQSNSSRLIENFCLIGTPLPSLEKAKDSGEFVPLWKQEVRDEKGRRRLHGAFTGGFSAGYYNTVGSKEGWVPSTFTSSRGERASKKQAKPEDFMDDEDLAEIRDSKKLVDTTEETDIFGGTKAELARRKEGGEMEKDSIANALESLLPPSKDSVGARLLKKMGWRFGQGIGPRVTYHQLRVQDGRPVDKDEPIDEEARKHLYAPRDTKIIEYHKKDNAFGLGYTLGNGLSEIVRGHNEHHDDKGPNLSAGFGLGALNDAEDDDLDVYDRGLPREGRHLAYDAGETEDNDRITLHDKKARSPDKVSTGPVRTASVTFRDGRPVVLGFILSKRPLIEDRWFPIPDIPKGWMPDPRRAWAKGVPNEQDRVDSTPHMSTVEHHRSSFKGKTADERGSILGETPLSAAPRSVFDYLSQKDRDRLKNLATSIASGSALPTRPIVTPTPINIPHTDPRTAQAALKGFQPFTTDPGKQFRYTAYLQSQAALSDNSELKPLPGQSNDDFNKELSDYAKAALIFKPVSGAMAGRFATASTSEMLGNTNQGLHQPTKEDYARLEVPKTEEQKEEVVEESPKVHAARAGMFGPLTRETLIWQPARLLCKRFGVKDPHPDGIDPATPVTGAPDGKSQAWKAEMTSVSTTNNAGSTSAGPSSEITSPSVSYSPGKRDLTNIGLGEDEEQGKDTLTYERPTKDIFKAIFASDEEESDEEGDKIDGAADEPVAVVPVLAGTSASVEHPSIQAVSEENIDLATFRPTFVPKSERMKMNDKGWLKKDRDKKKKGKMVVSFDVDDEGGVQTKEKERRKEKRRKKDRTEEPDDDHMWVEKPPPEITKDLVVPLLTEPDADGGPHHRGRKRAVDFL